MTGRQLADGGLARELLSPQMLIVSTSLAKWCNYYPPQMMQLLSLTPARAIRKRRRHTSVLAWWTHARDVGRWHNPEIRTPPCTVGDSDLRDLFAGPGC